MRERRAVHLTKYTVPMKQASPDHARRERGTVPAPRGFLPGRHYEQRVDALALRAEEGRGIPAKSVGEPGAGCEPTMSEWGNPTVLDRDRASGGNRGN